MVPLQAGGELGAVNDGKGNLPPTEFLLDDLEDLLLIELLWQTLDSRQSLTTISL
jgi:hypothetical protein